MTYWCSEKGKRVECNLNWSELWDAPYWYLTNAIRYTTELPDRSPEEIRHWLDVTEEMLDPPDYEVMEHPIYEHAQRAIDCGDLKLVHAGRLQQVVRPLDFLKWRAQITFAGPMPPDLLRFLDQNGIRIDGAGPADGGSPAMKKPAGNITWDLALDYASWTLTQAIRLTTKYKESQFADPNHDYLGEGLLDQNDQDLLDHPFHRMAIRAIEAGELRATAVGKGFCVKPKEFLDW